MHLVCVEGSHYDIGIITSAHNLTVAWLRCSLFEHDYSKMLAYNLATYVTHSEKTDYSQLFYKNAVEACKVSRVKNGVHDQNFFCL